MKSFFSKVSSMAGFSDTSTSNPSTVGGPDINEEEDAVVQATGEIFITQSAQRLSDTVQEILNNTASLTGSNVSGFERLLSTLDGIVGHDASQETSTTGEIQGLGCLQVLISNMNNKRFIEICSKLNLAVALIHVLRLLRMYEIKLEKHGAYLSKSKARSSQTDNVKASPSIQKRGITYSASEKVSIIFGHLCTNPQTIELIRNALVKLLTFPLSALPPYGAHIQIHASAIVASLSKQSFTSQQVWYLHDVQAIFLMVKQLQELASISDLDNGIGGKLMAKQTAVDNSLLRGPAAEQAGLWPVAVRCLVDILLASIQVDALVYTV